MGRWCGHELGGGHERGGSGHSRHSRRSLPYEVTLETVVEGGLELLEVAKAAHRACLKAGARSVITHIKLAERAEGADLTSDDIMARYR